MPKSIAVPAIAAVSGISAQHWRVWTAENSGRKFPRGELGCRTGPPALHDWGRRDLRDDVPVVEAGQQRRGLGRREGQVGSAAGAGSAGSAGSAGRQPTAGSGGGSEGGRGSAGGGISRDDGCEHGDAGAHALEHEDEDALERVHQHALGEGAEPRQLRLLRHAGAPGPPARGETVRGVMASKSGACRGGSGGATRARRGGQPSHLPVRRQAAVAAARGASGACRLVAAPPPRRLDRMSLRARCADMRER